MSHTLDIDIVRLEGQLYVHSPHLRCENEILKQDRRHQLREQLQNSIPKVELEMLDMDTIIRNSDSLFEKSQHLNVLNSVDFESEESTPKPLRLSDSSEDDGEYTRPLSVIKQLERKEKERKMQLSEYFAQTQQPPVPDASLGSFSGFNDSDDKTWTVGRTVRKSQVSIVKRHKQNRRRSFRGSKRKSVRNNGHKENDQAPDTPLTLSIRLPEVIRENRKKLEISIDLGRIDLSRQILSSELCCFNEEQHTQQTLTNAINEEMRAIENTPSSQQPQHIITAGEIETEDDKALSHLISEVLVEPNAVETWRATNAIDNINNNLADNYNVDLAELSCYADSAANNGKATKRRKNNNNKKKPQGPPKKRGRKPGKKNCPKLESFPDNEDFESQPKSDLAKYVELFSNNCELPGSTTPAASSTMSQLVTSTTQHLDAANEQPITYYIEGDWANGGSCQLISTGNGDTGQITNEDFNMTELVNYIDSSTTDVGNNVIAQVLEGGNVVPVSVSLPSFSNVYSNHYSSNIIQLPTMKYVNGVNNSHHILSHAPLPLQCHTIATNMQISSMSLLPPPPTAHNCDGVLDLSKKSSNPHHCLNIFTTNNNSGAVQNYDSSDYGPIDLSIKYKKQPNETVPQRQQIAQHISVDEESDDNFIRRLIETSGIDFKPDVSRNPSYTFCPQRQTEQRLTTDKSFKAALDMPLLDMENSLQNEESLKTPPSLTGTADSAIKASNNLSLNTSLISGNNVFNTIEFADQSSKELFERLLEVGDSVNLECENNNDLTMPTDEKTEEYPNSQLDGDLNNFMKLFDTNTDNSKDNFAALGEKDDLKKPDTPLDDNKMQLQTENEVEMVKDTLQSNDYNDANDNDNDSYGNDNDYMKNESEVYGQRDKNNEDSNFLLDCSPSSVHTKNNNTVITGVEKEETKEVLDIEPQKEAEAGETEVEKEETKETIDGIEPQKEAEGVKTEAEKEETEDTIENKETVILDEIERQTEAETGETEDNIESANLNEVESNENENELKGADLLQDEVITNSAEHTNANAISGNDNNFLKCNSRNANNRKVDIISVVHLDSFNWTKDADNAYIQRILSKDKPYEKLNEHYNDGNNNAKDSIKFESIDLISQNKCNADDEEKTDGIEIPTVNNIGKIKSPHVGPTKNISASGSICSEDLLFVDIEDFQRQPTLAVANKEDPLELIATSTADRMIVEDLNESTTSCYSPQHKNSNIDLIEDEARGDNVNIKLPMPKLALGERNSEACDVLSLDLQHEMESDVESTYVLSQQKMEVHDVDYLQQSDKNNNDVTSMEGSQEIVNTNSESISSRLSNEDLNDVVDAIKNNDDGDNSHEQGLCLQLSEKSNDENIIRASSQDKQTHDVTMSNAEDPATPNSFNANAKYKNDDTVIDRVIDDLELTEECQDIKISKGEHNSNDVDTKKDNKECGSDCVNENVAENEIPEISNCLVNVPESQDIDMSDVSSNPSTQNLTDVDDIKMKDEIVCDCDDYDIQLSEESQDMKISNINDAEKQNLNDVDGGKKDNDGILSNCYEVEMDESHITSNEVLKESQKSEISNVDIDISSSEKQNFIDMDGKQDKNKHKSSEEDEFLQLTDRSIKEATKESQDTEISDVDSFGFSSSIQKHVHVDAEEDNDDVCIIDDDDDHNNDEEDKYLQLSHNTNNEVMKESQDIKISTTNISSSPTKQNVNVVDATKYQHGSSITKDDKLFPNLSILEMELKLDDNCLDYDGEIEDDALSLATSCFNSPDEDRFSDSKLTEEECKEMDAGQSIDAEQSSRSGSRIDEVISTEPISQSTTPQAQICSNPKEQCIEKGGYFLRKFRIPKVSCAEVTADCIKPTSMGRNPKQTASGQSDNNETSCSKIEHTSAGTDDSLLRRFKIPKLCAETTTKFRKSPAILCTKSSCPQKSTEITTNKRHYENITRVVHNECSTEAETSEPFAGAVANALHHLPLLTTTITAPATTFTLAQFQRGAEEIEMCNLVVPAPAHLLAEYAKLSRGKFARSGGEALNRGPATQHIAKIFGVTCLSFLADKCFELAACPFSHNFLDAALVKRRLELLPAVDVNAAYQFMYNHQQLFRRYFNEFCKLYTNQKNSNKLLNMVYDCERRGENVPFLRSIFYSLVKCGLSKINACRHILSRSHDESKPTIDTLVSIIVESDWTMFSDHIERFSKIKHYTFRFNDLNQMATTVLDAKDSRLSQVFFNCLLTIEPEELGLIQQSPILLHFLKLIESGKMRQ